MAKIMLKRIVPILLLVFGTLYTLISDFAIEISKYTGFGNVLIIKISIAVFFVFISLVYFFIVEKRFLLRLFAKHFGFIDIERVVWN